MITALSTAQQGLLQAERRATNIARDILKTTSEDASFTTENGKAQASAGEATDSTRTGGGPGTTAPINSAAGFGGLIQQFSDLRAEQRAFEANAKAFKAADESLGTLLDDLG